MAIRRQNKPVSIKSLNNTSYIIANDNELLDACIHFNEKVRKLLRNHSLNSRQLRFKASVDIPKSSTGFMIGAARASFYYQNFKGEAKELLTESYMMVSGDFSVFDREDGIEKNALPQLVPPGYHFVRSSGYCSTLPDRQHGVVPMKYRLEEFHEHYFKNWKIGSWNQKGKETLPVCTIFGVPFYDFHRECINKDKAFRSKYCADVSKYKSLKSNLYCAAQQLIVFVGDRVAQLKQTEKMPGTDYKIGPIYPMIELCETWFPSPDNSVHDRLLPEFEPVCSCATCELVLPYLITHGDIDEKRFRDFFKNTLVKQFGHQKTINTFTPRSSTRW